jgi:aryl-alcohol dehydrogenase-like predicted oxidoreductase
MRHQLIFGTASLHRLASPRSRQRAIAAAYDAGIRAFDLAPAYGNGIDEVEIGIAVRGKRHELELNTKYGIPIVMYGPMSRRLFAGRRLLDRLTGQSVRAYRRRDFSPRALTRSLDESLARLRTDHVDCLFVHEPISRLSAVQLDDIVACGRLLKARGKIRNLGVAGPLSSIELCDSLGGFDVVQSRCEDLPGLPQAVGDRPLILYGVHAAYRTAHATDFRRFVQQLLANRDGMRVIVTSRNVGTIGTFRGLLE